MSNDPAERAYKKKPSTGKGKKLVKGGIRKTIGGGQKGDRSATQEKKKINRKNRGVQKRGIATGKRRPTWGKNKRPCCLKAL